MRPGGGKKTGNQFEREICKTLSLWWSNGEDDDIFYRSASSGGRATNRARKGKTAKHHCGDVAALNPSGRSLLKFFTVEIKRNYPKVSLTDLLDSTTLQITNALKPRRDNWFNWIKQAKAARKSSGSFSWCVIMRRKTRQPIIVFPKKVYNVLEKWLTGTHPCFEMMIGLPDSNTQYLVAMLLDDFTANIARWNIKDFIVEREL